MKKRTKAFAISVVSMALVAGSLLTAVPAFASGNVELGAKDCTVDGSGWFVGVDGETEGSSLFAAATQTLEYYKTYNTTAYEYHSPSFSHVPHAYSSHISYDYYVSGSGFTFCTD